MQTAMLAVLTLGLGLQSPAVLAQSEGWGTGYQMGTSYAGVGGADGTRLTFYCGDAAAARANPAIVAGPYLMAVLPKTQLKDALPSAIEIVTDDKVTRVPVKAQAGVDEVELTWTPSRDFGLSEMQPVVAACARRSGSNCGPPRLPSCCRPRARRRPWPRTRCAVHKEAAAYGE